MRKIKFSNISTKAEVQGQRKGKLKVWKTFGFASLALLMGVAGVFAFAPLGTSPNVANANELETTTETGGLITPKADDPVIYTTERGIEIKYGNAIPTNTQSSLGSGNLKGFPYFTTTNGSTTYTWVIIGRNPNVTTLSTAVQSYLFSTWKANNPSSDSWKYSKSFFANTYETTTPAGTAINNVVSSKSYVSDNISLSISGITSHGEIPSDSVLALSNTITTTTYWNPTYTDESQCFVRSSNNINKICTSYYTNDTFGFGTYKPLLQKAALEQYDCWNKNNVEEYIYETAYMYFFPLGIQAADSTLTPSDKNYENFRWKTYLTANQYKLSSKQFGRSAAGSASCNVTHPDGSTDAYLLTGTSYTAGLRPACVLKVME